MAKSGFADQQLLAMALLGYEAQKAKLDAAIADIQAELGQGASSARSEPPICRKRTMSAAGRRRIAAAQRKRWAAIHNAKTKPKAAKRKLSSGGRKAIAAAARRRWAAVRKSKQRVSTA